MKSQIVTAAATRFVFGFGLVSTESRVRLAFEVLRSLVVETY